MLNDMNLVVKVNDDIVLDGVSIEEVVKWFEGFGIVKFEWEGGEGMVEDVIDGMLDNGKMILVNEEMIERGDDFWELEIFFR